MSLFLYAALDRQGVEIKDEIEALSEKEAIGKIRGLGYFPTKIRPKGVANAVGKAASKSKARRGANAKVKVKSLTEFARQLSTLQDAGLPILQSLRILQEQQKSGSFRRIIGHVADDIEGGSTLSEAMSHYPRCFDRLFCNMVAAGETGGVLDVILSRLADFKEKALRLKGRVKGAMIYPCVVLLASFLIVLGLMTFVIPQFQNVLTEMVGGKLNPITTAVLGISAWVAKDFGWAWMIGVPIAMIFFLRFLRKFHPCRYVMDAATLRLPVVGPLTNKIAVTRWTRTLGTLIAAGVPILDAINVARETAGNEVFARVLAKIHNSIRQGDTFAAPLRASKTVDLIVCNMVAVGEETGELDKMLLTVADNYDEQVDVLVGSLMSMLEPIMVLGLGTVVAFIVLAVFLPMIQVMTALSASGG